VSNLKFKEIRKILVITKSFLKVSSSKIYLHRKSTISINGNKINGEKIVLGPNE
jgi:hypothetical protein